MKRVVMKRMASGEYPPRLEGPLGPSPQGSIEWESRPMIEEPTHTDVLLGRGNAVNRHVGNETFRAIVGQHVVQYASSTKKEKMMISRSIADKIQTQLNPPGRFLERNAETGLWQEVANKRALEKVAQALRDGVAPLRGSSISNDMKRIAPLRVE